ncbi:hypothetical protein N9L68_04480 [bacterium]|nr:hypothetical protein [bacterium]
MERKFMSGRKPIREAGGQLLRLEAGSCVQSPAPSLCPVGDDDRWQVVDDCFRC